MAVDKVVDGIEVDVGEKLGSLVAEGEAAATLEGGEQVVAWEIAGKLLLGVGAGNDGCRQSQGGRAFDDASQLTVEDLVVDGGEVFADVALEAVGVPGDSKASQGEGCVGAFADTAGEGMGGEAGFEVGFQNLSESMVNDSITEGGRGDGAWFWVDNGKGAIRTRTIDAREQLPTEGEDCRLKIEKEGGYVGALALTGGGAVGGV